MKHNFTEKPHHISGIHRNYDFVNGFQASVIKSSWSMGGDKDLWELAIINKDGHIDEVYGNLTDVNLEELLDKIDKLPT